MKKVLFATTATAALAIGGVASAQGIALFGDARLGLGYNIDNDGGILLETNNKGEVEVPDDLRAVSRVRFGVNMTGETDSGITFGATIRADNAAGGQGGSGNESGQRSGSVFVSGSWGTLTYGDTNAADEQWVGDVPGNYSLTGLVDFNESLFVSNGGTFGNDSGADFASNPFARPTVRYDFDIMGFGISVSSNRDLTDVGVGAGYAADFGGGSWSLGVGYYNFDSFEAFDVVVDRQGNSIVERTFIPDGEQWSVGLNADYDAFGFGITYLSLDAESSDAGAKGDNLLVGASYTFDAWSLGAVYGHVFNAEGDLHDLDGDNSWMVTGQYDLGGGATINGGIRQTYDVVGATDGDNAIIGDFGVKMAF